MVDEILNDPDSARRSNRYGGEDVIAPDGRGVRFDRDGSLRGFLEP